MLKRHLFFREEDTGGGGSAPTQAPEKVADHVDAATTGATQAANETGNDGWKTVVEELKGIRDDIGKLLTNSTQPKQEADTIATNTTAPVEHNVQVAQPEPKERKVRRGMRKVTRRG